MLQKLAR